MYDAVNGSQIQRLFIFMRLRKSLCKILRNKTFKIVRSVLKIKKDDKYFMKYFFLDSCIFNKNLNETSKDIIFCCKYQISLSLIFFNFSHRRFVVYIISDYFLIKSYVFDTLQFQSINSLSRLTIILSLSLKIPLISG